MATFPINTTEIDSLSNKPIFLLDAVSKSAFSTESIPIDDAPVITFNKTVHPPVSNKIELVPQTKTATPSLKTPTYEIVESPPPADQLYKIYSDMAKLSNKSYTPRALFEKYSNSITGTQSEFYARVQNKTFVGIDMLKPKNKADIQTIMNNENIKNVQITQRLRLLR
jgi:hypothetical protein